MNKDPIVFIKHIRDSITDIERYTKSVSKDKFFKNKMLQDAIIHKVEIIGEAAKNLSASFIKKYPPVPWKDIIGMRDKLIHNYFGVNIERVWIVVQEDIPQLKMQIDEILRENE